MDTDTKSSSASSSSSTVVIDVMNILKRIMMITIVFLLGYIYIQRSSNDSLLFSSMVSSTVSVSASSFPSVLSNSTFTSGTIPVTGSSSVHPIATATPAKRKRKGTRTATPIHISASPSSSTGGGNDDDTDERMNDATKEIIPSPSFIRPFPPTAGTTVPSSTPSTRSSSFPCLNHELVYVGMECIYTNPPGTFPLRVDDNYHNHGLSAEPFQTINDYITGKEPESTHRCTTWKNGLFRNYSFTHSPTEQCISAPSTYAEHFPNHAYSLYPSEMRSYTSTNEWYDAPITVLQNNSLLPPSSFSSVCTDSTKPYCGWKYWTTIDATVLAKRKQSEILRGYLYDPNDGRCCLPPYIPHAQRAQCLAGERIAMVGDSIMRQLFTQMVATLRGLHYAFDQQHHSLNRHTMNWETHYDTYQPCITAAMLMQNIANDITHIWPPNFPASVSTDTTFFWNPLYQDPGMDDTVFAYEPTILIAGLHFWEEHNSQHNLFAIQWLIRTLERNTRIRKVVWTLPPRWGNYASKKRPNDDVKNAIKERETYLVNALHQILYQTRRKRSGGTETVPHNPDVPNIPEISSFLLPDHVEGLMIVDTSHLSTLPLIDPYRTLDGFHFTCIANPEGSAMHDWMTGTRVTPMVPPFLVVLPPVLNSTCSDPYTYNIIRQILSGICNP